MLHKWKSILTNWINCYFNDTKTEECININSLLTIISHLHKNFSLDESKSSTLEAQTIEEFILEKYPQFKFENGTVEPTNEVEIYMVASLLLFFVCVNSKDLDIKQAMCSKLGLEDQETIMKFSKGLMECSPLTHRDVMAAIAEACGQDVAAGEKAAGPAVAETPPALRSLHGEVRRLQAALDAERFDRNYLQEELARNNLRMEKLLKEKEQFKLEIMNLKAKISLCCGEEAEARGTETTADGTAKLTRQLNDLEERLVVTQEQLEDAQAEREAYKTKLEELKQERDKWVNLTQQETSRAGQLAEELETERRRVLTLEELVAELRLHHQKNGLDASQFECDDPDASINSLQNASVCSEACANVIEVQLSEERAKCVFLSEQIHSLQEQVNELTKTAESEKLTFENIVSEKDNNISDLKHRINEEIQEKKYLKEHYNDAVSKLNNEINELEQKLKENCEYTSTTIEQKMQEIQTLQEEKLSLIQSLSDETTKLENIIKDLQTDIDTEKNLKVTMKESYENQLMKLNEKVLNRNNELVELQNKIFEKGEMIEELNCELKREKEQNHELSNKYNNDIVRLNEERSTIEKTLRQKTDEANELQRRLFQNVSVFSELNREIDDLKVANMDLLQNYRILEQEKQALEAEIQQRDSDVEGIRKEIENITNIFGEEKDKFTRNVEEKNATISLLQIQLHDEIQYKNGLEKELQQLNQEKNILNEEVLKLNKELSASKLDISEKERMIYALDLYLKEEKHACNTLKAQNEKLSEHVVKLTKEISTCSSEMNALEEKLGNENMRLEEDLRRKEDELETTSERLFTEIQERETLQTMLLSLNEEKAVLSSDLVERCNDFMKLQDDYDTLCRATEQNIQVIEALGNKIDAETKKYLQLEIDFDTHTSNLLSKLDDTEKYVKEVTSKSKNMIRDKELKIETLHIEVESLNKSLEKEKVATEKVVNEKEALAQKLDQEISFKNNIEKEYQNQCAILDNIISQLNNEIQLKSSEINTLKNEVDQLLDKANAKTEELRVMEAKIKQETEITREVAYQKDREIEEFKRKIAELNALNDEFEQELKKEIASKSQAIDALQRENEQLHFTIEEDNSNHEMMIKEKDVMIESLDNHLKCVTIKLESIRKDYEDGTFTWERAKIEMQDKLKAKENEIHQLRKQITELKHSLEQNLLSTEKIQEDQNKHTENFIKERNVKEAQYFAQIEKYTVEIAQYQTSITSLKSSNDSLKAELCSEKAVTDILKSEKENIMKEKLRLLEELKLEKNTVNNLQSEKEALLKEKSVLMHEVLDTKSVKETIERDLQTLAAEKQFVESKEQVLLEEKEHLLAKLKSIEKAKEVMGIEKHALEQQLTLETDLKHRLVKEKENLVSEFKSVEQEKQGQYITLKSSKEVLVAEKEILSLKLESLEKEKSALLTELQGTEQQRTDETIAKNVLLEEKEILSKTLESVEQEKQTLLAEQEMLKKKLIEEIAAKDVLLQEKETLLQKIQSTEQDRQVLFEEQKALKQKTLDEEAAKNVLLKEKEDLYQQLQCTKQTVLAEKLAIEQLMTEERKTKDALLDEKESLSQLLENGEQERQTMQQQLADEKTAKNLLLEGNNSLTQQLETLEQEKQSKEFLVQELESAKTEVQEKIALLEEEKQALEWELLQKIEVEKSHMKEKEHLLELIRINQFENQSLLTEKETTEQRLIEETALKCKILEEKKEFCERLETIKDIAKRNKKAIELQLSEQKRANNMLLEEKTKLESLKDMLEKDKQALLIEKEAVLQQLIEEKRKIKELSEENNTLLEEFNSAKGLLQQGKQTLILEKEAILQQLSDEVVMKNSHMKEKELLVNELIQEKSAKDALEQENKVLQETNVFLDEQLKEELRIKSNLEDERDYLLREKNELNESINRLNQQISEDLVARSTLQDEICRLNEYVKEERSSKCQSNEEKQNLFTEMQILVTENSTLKHNIVELNAVQEILVHDKEVLNLEKEKLIQTLNVEKASRDELESEKKTISISLQELTEKYASEMKEKQEQLTTVSTELKQMKTDFKNHEDISVHIASALGSGLEKLFQNIKKDDFGNEILEKLVTVDQRSEVPLTEKCDLLVKIADTLYKELSLRRNLLKTLEHESSAVDKLKEMQTELQTEVKRLQQVVNENQMELSKQMEIHNTAMDSKVKDIQNLQLENKSLSNELNNVKIQLDVKVHSLKEKLIDNENLTDKLKRTYECQIENLNVMVTKLTSYLKEKTTDLDFVRRENEKLHQVIDENNKVRKSLEEEVKSHKVNQEKLISDFEAERQVLKNMVAVTESIMEDQKVSLNKVIIDHEKTIDVLQEEKKTLEQLVQTTRKTADEVVQGKQHAIDAVFKDLAEIRKEKGELEKEIESKQEFLNKEIAILKEEITLKSSNIDLLERQIKNVKKEKEQCEKDAELEQERLQKQIEILKKEIQEKANAIETLQSCNQELSGEVNKLNEELLTLQEKDIELKIKKDSLETELLNRIEKLAKVLGDDTSKNDKFKYSLQEKLQEKPAIQEKIKAVSDEIVDLVKEKNKLKSKLDEVKAEFDSYEIKSKEEIQELKDENERLAYLVQENNSVIVNLEQLVKREVEQNQKLREDNENDRVNIETRCLLLQEYQTKAEKRLQETDKEISALYEQARNNANFEEVVENLKEDLTKKDTMITKIAQGKDEVINTLSKELASEKVAKEKYQKELQDKARIVYELRQKLEEVKGNAGVLVAMKKENDALIKAAAQRESSAASHERATSHKVSSISEKEHREQVSTTSDLTHSSMESLKTITDLEKIIHDKNRTITTLQSDITYMKSLMAESENKLLDVSKELEITKEHCEQLSCQLKKTVHHKNEEIAELKKQVNKMSVAENRATQIIKVSAKYQAIILKRIAEIKSNTILKELTNFGNTANCDSELKRNLNSGSITMEDLENFLETTDRHLKRCTEKQLTLQKDRDRLTEVNKINESEIINLKKFLTELSVSFKTFSSIKELYTQKLSRVVSIQRTVRREILSLDGQITDAAMCKLERGYAAVLQDLCECTMTLERWVERSIARTISAEKIKQAFTSDTERVSLATTSFQNAGLEVQLEELENSFQKLLEEVVRAQKGEGAKEPQAVTVMEVRAEYEDKLNRMKAKMKQLYQEQIQVFKNKQKEEIAALERELQRARDKLTESSRAYEEHIKSLTTELWNVGEKFLMKKDEAEWLRKKQISGSLMSLQQMHSAGLLPSREEYQARASDTFSLRSLPMHSSIPEKREVRGLHMSDEEGEVFDNRWLKELQTPKRESNAGVRLSELRWRNSLCPPHLKSSYPAETQFANAVNEEDIKCVGAASLGGRNQRKEVGITAYKKPGPPTPSKQAGRLSATDSELRESLRSDQEAAPSRKTSTPSRLRALFRSGRNDIVDGTPRRRLSNIFRKK